MRPRERCHFSACSLSCPFSAGFTLIETMIVFLLLSIVTMLGWPSLSASLEHHRLSGAASEIVTALEFAQLNTASSGRQIRVTINAGADTILMEQFTCSADFSQSILNQEDVESGSFSIMQHPLNRGPVGYNISLPDESRFQGVDITAVAFGANNWVVFDALGAPSSGGTVTLACGSRQMVVTLDALTGKVTVSD
jgi:type II secretory pathway pseudopilin PulG